MPNTLEFENTTEEQNPPAPNLTAEQRFPSEFNAALSQTRADAESSVSAKCKTANEDVTSQYSFRQSSSLRSASSSSVGKFQRIDIPNVLDRMQEQLTELKDSFDRTVGLLDPKPVSTHTIAMRKTAAIKKVQEEMPMLDEELVVIINYFQADVSAADAYLAMQTYTLRKTWITEKVTEIALKNERILRRLKAIDSQYLDLEFTQSDM